MKLPVYNSFAEKAVHFSHIVIDTKDVLDTHIKELTENSPNCIFRGVNEAKYKLYTSVQREWITNGLGRHITINALVDSLIKEIRQTKVLNDYYTSLNICQTDFIYLSLLQHYSAPTPLLDFSHDFHIALYFATKDIHTGTTSNILDDYFSLYYIDLDKCGNELVRMDNLLNLGLNRGHEAYEESMKNDPLLYIDKSLLDDIDEFTQWNNPRNPGGGMCNLTLAFIDNPMNAQSVITPYTQKQLYWSNLNIIAQQGCFLLYNNEDIPVETYIGGKNKYIPRIWCMDIHKSLEDYIHAHYLQGLSTDTLFPDINRMAKSAYMHFKERL